MKKFPTPDEFITENGYTTWHQKHDDNADEVVINYEDCKQAMEEYHNFCAKEIKKEHSKYKKAFQILESYFDSISDEEQEVVSKQLEKIFKSK
jgi:hypothetical protein